MSPRRARALTEEDELAGIVDTRSIQLDEVHAVHGRAPAFVTSVPRERAESSTDGGGAHDPAHQSPSRIEYAEHECFASIGGEHAIRNGERLPVSRSTAVWLN